MKTTAQAAADLGIKPDKLRRILAKYTSYAPTQKFNGGLVWTDKDIDRARNIVAFIESDLCPHCQKRPDGTGPGAEELKETHEVAQ